MLTIFNYNKTRQLEQHND